jgi:glycine cleavage system H protein
VFLLENPPTQKNLPADNLQANEALDDEPELVNTSCYDNGWLVKFKSDAIDGLMDADTYSATLD